MKDLKLSQIKQICEIIGCNPTDLPNELDDWKLLDDSEADEMAGEYIRESIWAFNADFLSGETGIDSEVFKAIQDNDKCEDNNEAIESIIQGTCGMESIIDSAIGHDGRGHFLSSYDGEEHEITGNLYLYREN